MLKNKIIALKNANANLSRELTEIKQANKILLDNMSTLENKNIGLELDNMFLKWAYKWHLYYQYTNQNNLLQDALKEQKNLQDQIADLDIQLKNKNKEATLEKSKKVFIQKILIFLSFIITGFVFYKTIIKRYASLGFQYFSPIRESIDSLKLYINNIFFYCIIM